MIKFLKSFFGGKSAEPEATVVTPVTKVEEVNSQPVVKVEAPKVAKAPAKKPAAKKPATAKKPAAAKAPAKKPAAKKAPAKKAK
mgnify:CR=1 FL=1|jgi:hypothetical protein